MANKLQQNQQLAIRLPTQARAREKVQLMLEATVRILSDEGIKALTTNRIAEVAGVSIGTLYQYFRGKEDVMERLAEQELARVMDKLAKVLKSDLDADAEDRVPVLVRTLLGAFSGRYRVRKFILEAGMAQNSPSTRSSGGERLATLLAAAGTKKANGGRAPLSAVSVFVIGTAVMSVIRAAVLRDEKLLSNPELENCLVQLIRGFVAMQQVAASQTSPPKTPPDPACA